MINDPSESPDFSLAGAAQAMAQYVQPPLSEPSGSQNHVSARHSFQQETQPTEAGAFYGEHASPSHDRSSCGYCQPGH